MPPAAMKVLAVSFALALLPSEARLGTRQSSAAALGTEGKPKARSAKPKRSQSQSVTQKVWAGEKEESMQLGKTPAGAKDKGSAKYEMVTVFEEAYFEKYTMCHIAEARSFNEQVLKDIGAGSLDKTKVISVGSSSTQVYSCGEYRGGFFSGAQDESLTQAEVDAIGKWLADTQPAKAEDAAKDVVVLQSSALVSVVDALCPLADLPEYCVARNGRKALQIWPEPKSHYEGVPSWRCTMKEDLPGKLKKTIDSEEPTSSLGWKLAKALKAIVQPYQRAFCRAGVKNTVLVTGTKLNNDWTKALQEALGADYTEGTIVDWGGSGPKPPTTYLKDKDAKNKFAGTYNNVFLVDKCDPGAEHYKHDTCKKKGTLNCAKLKTALKDVVAQIKAWQEHGPWFIGQTGLAREKWMEGLVDWDTTEACDLDNGLKISKWSGDPLRARILGNQASAALAWLQLPANATFQIKRS